MLCPFHLEEVQFKQGPKDGRLVYTCPVCNEQIPTLYAQEYKRYPPVVVNAIGFRGHGKTVYFAALFYALRRLCLAQQWEEFFTMGLNDESLDTVRENVDMLAKMEMQNLLNTYIIGMGELGAQTQKATLAGGLHQSG